MDGAYDAMTLREQIKALTAENTALQKQFDEVNDFEKAQRAQLLVKLEAMQADLTRVTAERDQMAGWVEVLCDVDVPEDPDMIRGALEALNEIGWRGQKEAD